MTDTSAAVPMEQTEAHTHSGGVLLRTIVIGLTAFLTVVDLFATQSHSSFAREALRRLARSHGLCRQCQYPGHGVFRPGRRLFQPRDRPPKRNLISLVLLAIPTALIAHAPDLTTFTILRVLQAAVHGGGLYPHARLSR